MSNLANVPCTIVTGFLGAGKTTLVRHVLENADGRRLAIQVGDTKDFILLHDMTRGTSRRLPATDSAGWPKWSADGETLAYTSFAEGKPWQDEDHFATTWYQPWADPDGVSRGVRFALSTPGVHAFCTPGDLDILPLALDAAANLTPMTDEESTPTTPGDDTGG